MRRPVYKVLVPAAGEWNSYRAEVAAYRAAEKIVAATQGLCDRDGIPRVVVIVAAYPERTKTLKVTLVAPRGIHLAGGRP